ncbi:MAG TPA: DUF881 domain-containing protein [Cellulomonadaceae bacterium]|nr:DUF881 domain-containing protein [Cellulomonadaceae bacterium]
MTRHPRRRRLTTGTVAVGIVLALAGVLFAANARLAQGQESRAPQSLRDLAVAASDRLAKLTTQVDSLRADVEQLTTEQAPAGTAANGAQTSLVEIASGRVAVAGPGLTVQLTDAPADSLRQAGVRPDDLLVHQQDLQVVINALWAGGAEAMSLQGQRVISTTAFRCVGNVLSLHGRLYSPPYVIRAIGDPKELRAALYASPQIQVYLQYVDAVGLGWSVNTSASLTLPAYEGTTELQYASVPAGIDVLTTTADSATSGTSPSPSSRASSSPTSTPALGPATG